MSGNRRLNPRRDGNELDIVRALQSVGAMVVRINGQDVCDLIVFYWGHELLAPHAVHFVEVKMPKGKVSKGQQEFIDAVNAAGGHAGVVRTVEEALAFVGATS